MNEPFLLLACDEILIALRHGGANQRIRAAGSALLDGLPVFRREVQRGPR